jgi:flavin-dependent dehydrogenase
MSMGTDRNGADLVANLFPSFVEYLQRHDLLSDIQLSPADRRGGWLKMGLAGTVPARGQVLLVGDAAGAINPLAGEGISGAVLGGQDAATAILQDSANAAAAYRRSLAARQKTFCATTAALQAYMATHPRMLSLTGKILTAPGAEALLARPWSMYWNDLVDGASPGPTRFTAKAIGAFARVVTATSSRRRAIERRLTQAAPAA